MAATAKRKSPLGQVILAVFLGLLLAVLVFLLLIQLIPYARDHTNPPVLAEPTWNSAETRTLAQRACFDCHSNETVWPWYSHIAPASWLVMRDVQAGRFKMNFSEWGLPTSDDEEGVDIDEIITVIEEETMPPSLYLIPHPKAKLSAEEKQALVEGLRESLTP